MIVPLTQFFNSLDVESPTTFFFYANDLDFACCHRILLCRTVRVARVPRSQ